MPIKAFVDVINCYVLDLEEREKTLLLHEGEGKLSRVRSRLIYRFSRGSSVHRAGLHSGAEADRSGTVTDVNLVYGCKGRGVRQGGVLKPSHR